MSVSQLTVMRQNEADVMKRNVLLATPNRWKFNGWIVWGAVLVSFADGSLVTDRLSHANHLKTNSSRVFELRIYHAVTGKVTVLESLFYDASKLIARHGSNIVGFWAKYGDHVRK